MLANSPSARVRWEFLDGLRGLAAVYVVLFHIREEALKGMSPALGTLTYGLHYGHQAVCLFIVLSGFCLMLPVTRSRRSPDARDGTLNGGLSGFFTRRARRILPAFYAAVLFSLTMNVFSSDVVRALLHRGDPAALSPARLFPGLLAWDNVLSYLFLVNNFRAPDPVLRPDYPLWSVALEWQIYFLFALALLPLWRRVGAVWTVVAGLAFGLAATVLLGGYCYLWLIGLFALGMLASEIVYAPEWQGRTWNRASFFAPVAIIALLVGIGGQAAVEMFHWDVAWQWLSDIPVGIASAALILYAVHTLRADRRPPLIRLLDSRAALWLGAMSYSIYLMHKPVLIKLSALIGPITQRFPALGGDGSFLLYLVIGIPLMLGMCYLFYLAFERPYLSKRDTPKSSPTPTAPPGNSIVTGAEESTSATAAVITSAGPASPSHP